MLLTELLNEGVSPVVYHATSFKNAATILTTNEMKSHAGGISFTRSLTGSYHRSNRMIGVIFEFDGVKLNSKFKGGPVGTELYDFERNDDGRYKEVITMAGKENGQLEDRILTSSIPNVRLYIKSAIVYIPSEYIQTISKYSTDELDTVYASEVPYINTCLELLDRSDVPTICVASERDLTMKKQNMQQFIANYYKLERIATGSQDN